MQRIQLTDREDDVLHLVLDGLSNEEIATRLAISRRTVEAHLRTLYHKVGVRRRAQLVARYREGDLLERLPTPEAREAIGEPARPRSLQRTELMDYERQLRRYADAVHGLVDRQAPLFRERVELTVTVGEQDGQDIVVERRWTTPTPHLVYRIVGPIVPWPDGPPFDIDELALTCDVYGQDVQVEKHDVRDVDGRPLIMILFQPGLHTETEWELRYRSPGLWAPLRSSGQDSLRWATATFDQRHPTTTSDLTLRAVFPASWTAPRLTERSDFGSVHPERLPSGQTQLTWHHDAPSVDVRAYHWLLEGSPNGAAEHVG